MPAKLPVRFIPRLDIKGPNLVKGIHLEGLRVLGKPEAFAKHYYEQGADELIFIDTVASLYGRNHLGDIVERVAHDIFIPLCVGGGLRSVDDIRTVLRAGADKVSLNTQAIRCPSFISEAANLFGSSTIVVAIEVIRQPNGTYACFTDNGREATGVDAFSWARQAEKLGAGEIILTSVDREGTGKGFDIELCKAVSELVSIPVIAHGGAGSARDVVGVAFAAQVDAVCVASILHYHAVEYLTVSADEFVQEGNLEYLRQGTRPGRLKPADIGEIKDALAASGIAVRPGSRVSLR
jgi:cyclase